MPRSKAHPVAGKPSTGVGIAGRLMVLVLIPVTVMCAFAGTVVWSQYATAGRAQVVSSAVPRLAELVSLQDGLHALQMSEQFEIRFAQLGSSQAVASVFLGVDLSALARTARSEAMVSADALGPQSPVKPADLKALLAEQQLGTGDHAEILRRLTAYGNDAAQALTRSLNSLVPREGDKRLGAPLEALRVASTLLGASTPQGIELSTLWFPAPGAAVEDPSVLAGLGASTALYRAAVTRLHELNVRSVIEKLTAVEANAQVRQFDLAVDDALAGQPAPDLKSLPNVGRVAATFHGYLIRDDLLDDVAVSAVAVVRSEARHVARTSHTDFLLWVLGALGLALASLFVAWRISRSIARPLKGLALYAHAISEGQLTAEPPMGRRHGPRETRLALDVFGDLVDNLQLLDAKANALAHCDFENPVLAEPLPGRLGQSLESSVTVLSDSIVERDLLQTHLAHEATHDALTGALNRAAAIAGIQLAMNRATRSGAITAVLFIDLNEFKGINDSYGHEVGDEVLRQLSTRITESLRNGDFLARLGGDEFIVVAEDVKDVTDATTLARRVLETLEQPVDIGTHHIALGAAVGIAMSLDGPEDPLRLLARADAAMYRAKIHKRSAVEIFDADLQRDMTERVEVELALSAALADPSGGGLSLHYQPILDTASGTLAGVEALIRWDRPGHGPLAPDRFIPIAESSSLIIAVDRWVIDRVIDQLTAWSSVPELADIPVAVNISGRHLLSGQLPQHLRTALERSGIDAGRLSIELTETVVLDDLVTAAFELQAVRDLGISVAIDDFGTGYTSLAHLQQLPIDSIKIDRSLIGQLDMKRGLALVRMVAVLGHAIDVTVIGEGVETQTELNALQIMGADQLQGFLLSRPMTSDALLPWAREHAILARSETA